MPEATNVNRATDGCFYAWTRRRNKGTIVALSLDRGGPMRLFGRKQDDDEVEERCPQCSEPVPDGAVECMMCGVDLRPFREVASDEEAASSKTDSAA